MFNALEAKDRHLNTFRNYLKKMLGVIMSHRDIFEPLTSINYETITNELARDLPLLSEIQLPDTRLAHIY
jgi:hypothetical protein